MFIDQLTLSFPHFSNCGKNESTKAYWAPECQNVKKTKKGGLDQYGAERFEA